MIATPQKIETKPANPFIQSFDELQGQRPDAPSWLYPIRKAGISRFAELGLPTLRDEDWRFTNITPITALPFKPVADLQPNGLTRGDLAQWPFADLNAQRLVFLNGHFSQELSSLKPAGPGVHILNLRAALNQSPALLEKHLANYSLDPKCAFAALNTAFFHDGLFVLVPKNVQLEEPVHVLYVSTVREPGAAAHPRNLIVMEPGSSATILESHASLADATFFTNAVTEVLLGEQAFLELCKFQDASAKSFHMAALHAHLRRASHFRAHSIATGSRLSRNNIRVKLNGEGVDCILNGLYLTKAEQLADHHMIVEHAQPHCNSHEYFNGILDDQSRGVFHGRILVQPEAQKTDAKQTNKNLLLSDQATANTKPQLEIYADDVKCTHGATIGQLNEESIFYCRARGIGIETARRILIHAFAGEIIERIQHDPIREEIDKLIWDRLEQNPQIADQH